MSVARSVLLCAVATCLGSCTENKLIVIKGKPTQDFPVSWRGERLEQPKVAEATAQPEPEKRQVPAHPPREEERPKSIVVAPPSAPANSPVDNAPVTRMNQPNALAVVIGIEKYRSDIPSADHAENDAIVFARYATRTLGVPADNVKLLVGDRASKGDIESVLSEWLPSRAGKESVVYFFFSGHGAPDTRSGDSYLVPWDGDPAYLKSKGVRVSWVYEQLGKVNGKAVAFIDACFSGAGDRSVLPQGLRPLVPVKQAVPRGGVVAVLSASAASEVTGPASGSRHGLYTHHLLRGLSGLADRDGDRTVTLHELELFVTRHVRDEARKQNREQTPQLSASGISKPGTWAVVEGLVDN